MSEVVDKLECCKSDLTKVMSLSRVGVVAEVDEEVQSQREVGLGHSST